jgi:hypothetical protein
LALKVVRWHTIREIDAKRRLLAQDPGTLAPKAVCWPMILAGAET